MSTLRLFARPNSWTGTALIVGALSVGMPSFAAEGGHDHAGGGDTSEDAGGKGGGKMKGKMGGMMGGGMEHAEPGSESSMCGGHGGMLPHYCEPSYKMASSVRGVVVDDVKPGGDRVVIVTLSELNANHPGVTQKLAVVAGNGQLVGTTIVDAGWKDSKTISVTAVGDGTFYDHPKAHVHVFPVTGN